MSELIIWLYLKTMFFLAVGLLLFGGVFPTLLSADSWWLVVFGILGMFITAPVFMLFGYMIYNDVMDVISRLKKEKK